MGEEKLLDADFDRDLAYERLREWVDSYPPRCQGEAGRALGISEGIMSEMINRNRPVSLVVATRLGLIREDVTGPLRAEISRLRKENEDLREYKSMYEGLCK